MKHEPCVFIVDDDHAVRDGFTLLFDAADIAVETYESAEAFLTAYNPERPGCLVLDVNMPGMSGPELQLELIKRHIRLPILFLTAHGDIPMTVRAMKAGAMDFLTKPVQGKQLLQQVKTAFTLDAQMREQASLDQTAETLLSCLTPRELEVMLLVVAGHANKEIARHLGISHRTVEIHRSRVMEKTGASNLLELARLADAWAISPISPPSEAD